MSKPFTKYLCDCCEQEIDIWAGIECGCYDHGVIEQRSCPTCWEWRDASEFRNDIDCCHDCRVHAKTMVRLGITGPDETLLDTYHERVRMRNCVVQESTPVSHIELRKGKIIGWIESRSREPIMWIECEKEWQVVDDFVINGLALPTII